MSLLPLLLLSEPAQEAGQAAEAAASAGTPEAAGHAVEAAGQLAEAVSHAAAAGHGQNPGEILMHHVLDVPGYLGPFSKHLVFFGLVALLVIVIVRMAMRGYRKGMARSPLANAVEATLLFIRDEIAVKNIGHDGYKFTPLLASFFFFILAAALFGLLPYSSTSTGNLSVTLALATVSFLAQQYAGISRNGLVHHFTGLVPPGLPLWLLPIMIPVEIIAMFSKPFALMVRLFANMLAGHMVIAALLMLIPLMAQISSLMGVAMIPVSLGLALFIMVLEVLVAFIQAYIFTLLSAIFIGMYAHPAH